VVWKPLIGPSIAVDNALDSGPEQREELEDTGISIEESWCDRLGFCMCEDEEL
jgi:hypothetical protein